MSHEKIKSAQRGAVTIVEATFVFPIMFFIVLLMILLGEAYYQHARVEYEVSRAAISAAARCENPMQEYVQNNGNSLPSSLSAANVNPYRYIYTKNAQSIASQAENELTTTINSMKPLAFRAMKPTAVSARIKAKMNVLVSSLQVECEYDIQFPIRMFFTGDRIKFHYSVSTVESIGDPSEFVRNVTTVKDIIERSKGATELFDKIGDGMSKLGRFVN